MRIPAWTCWALSAALGAGAARGQSNTIPGTDVSLGLLEGVSFLARTGVHPLGESAFSMSTTSCNLGSVDVPWRAPMQADHPFIAFLMVRESAGRLVQISDRSYVKHGFYALSNSQCIPCQHPSNGTFLGVGCSDTYGTGTNADNYNLGPPGEIDPWLGTWDPRCSHFDRGEPAASPPLDCDGVRSFSRSQSSNLGPLGHRVRVRDAELDVAPASFWYQAQYVIRGEPLANRINNLGSRRFVPSWNTAARRWDISVGDVLLHGSVLQRWSGAAVDGASNGTDDGLVYVAVRVSGPVNGLYHYEYALHNRDNARGISAFRLPVCSGARVLGAGFSDIDTSSANDWAFARTSGEISWASASNPLEWNTIYNFWFDSDAAPGAASSYLDEFRPGAGAQTFGVPTSAPLGLYNVYLGPGCGTPNPPELFTLGTPPRATLGNSSLRLFSLGNAPGASVFVLLSTYPGTTPLAPGCNLYLSTAPAEPFISLGLQANPFGMVDLPVPVPSDPAAEGLELEVQALELQIGAGAAMGLLDLSNGLRIRVGSAINGCS